MTYNLQFLTSHEVGKHRLTPSHGPLSQVVAPPRPEYTLTIQWTMDLRKTITK